MKGLSKKLKGVMLAMIAAALLIGSAGSAAAVINGSVDSVSTAAVQGGTYTVEISLAPSGAPETIWGMDIYVTYDTNVFDAPTLTDHNLGSGWSLDQKDANWLPGKVKFSKGSLSGPGFVCSSKVNVYQLVFPVKSGAPTGTTAINIDTSVNVYYIMDSTFGNITGTVTNASAIPVDPDNNPVIDNITWNEDNADNIKNKNHIYGTITITGSNFGTDPGDSLRDTSANKVSIGGVTVPDVVDTTGDDGIQVYYWDETTIVCGVPLRNEAGTNYVVAGDLPVVVTAASNNSNSVNIEVNPKVYAVTPPSGDEGNTIAIEGTAFGTNTGNVSVNFNGTAATPSAAANQNLTVNVPTGAISGQLLVTVNGKTSNTHYDWDPYDQVTFTVANQPVLISVSPDAGEQGMTTSVTITGENVSWSGDMTSSVHFSNSGITINSATGSGTTITANISIASTALISAGSVTVDGTNGSLNFSVTAPSEGPVITSITPPAAPAGVKITVAGLRFGADQGMSMLVFENTDTLIKYPVNLLSWSDTMIEAIVPTLAPKGDYKLRIIRIEITAGKGMQAFQSKDKDFSVTAATPPGGNAVVFPNPFNPLATSLTSSGMSANQATIAYSADGVASVGIYIYDTTARLVYHAVSTGNQVSWNGRDMQGELVADGVYLLRVVNEETKSLISKGKILVVKQ